MGCCFSQCFGRQTDEQLENELSKPLLEESPPKSAKFPAATATRPDSPTKPWYHGVLSHNEARGKFQSKKWVREGCYMVYKTSERDQNYVLLFFANKKLHRFQINWRSEDSKYLLKLDNDSSVPHETVEQLIRYYKDHSFHQGSEQNQQKFRLQHKLPVEKT